MFVHKFEKRRAKVLTLFWFVIVKDQNIELKATIASHHITSHREIKINILKSDKKTGFTKKTSHTEERETHTKNEQKTKIDVKKKQI